ncbi:hypothetical protein B0J11DRAFT_545150 [Dendryphion nanum]|uniref:Uncharacterized protein n=1 Tax=Dendryphion nanum TaxID=256645 RepID=A0A9P9CY70_9PLEO|nr:hypothetical protein B0J11DRAFT_545150 [Dendryphion nanum]
MSTPYFIHLLSILSIRSVITATPIPNREPTASVPYALDGPHLFALNPFCKPLLLDSSDDHGLSIRIGVYCHVLAYWLAKYFFTSQRRRVKDAITIFSMVLLLVVLIFAIKSSNLEEIYIIELCVVSMLLACCRAADSCSQNAKDASSLNHDLLVQILRLGSLCLNLWFLFSGLDSAKTSRCSAKASLFFKVDMQDSFHDIMKAVSFLSAIKFIHMLWWLTLRIWSEEDIEMKMDAGEKLFKISQGLHNERPQRSAYDPHSALFEQISRGDTFLQQCIAARSSQTASRMTLHIMQPCCGVNDGTEASGEERGRQQHLTMKNKLPAIENSPLNPTATPPSYATCVLAYCKALCTLRLPRRVAILMYHLNASRQLSIWRSPYQIHTALQKPDHQPSDWAIAIAARIRRAEAPHSERKLKWQLGIDMFITGFLMLQVELILRCNPVTSWSEMGTLGQLVPFFVGIGSLHLVVFGSVRDGIDRDRGVVEGGGEISLERRILMAYMEWKDCAGADGESKKRIGFMPRRDRSAF